MTLWELAKMWQHGVMDIDVTDKEIDMAVCIEVDTTREPKDWYDRFIETLAKKVNVEWIRDDMICCDFSGLYRKNREKWVELFDKDNGYWEFDEDEMEYNMALWTESFIAGYSAEGTYKELTTVLHGFNGRKDNLGEE